MEETKKAVQPLIRTNPDHVSGTALLDEAELSAKLALVIAMNGSGSRGEFQMNWMSGLKHLVVRKVQKCG